jgi:hypothetical protein
MKHLIPFLLASCVTTKPVAQVYIPPYIETQQGYVVPPYGDSALFTGIAMAVQGCDFPNALTDQILIDDGLIRRHPSDPKPHDPSSRDMVIGAMLGLVSRYNRCPQERKAIQWAWAAHMEYVKDGKLYPGAGVDKSLTPGLKFLWQSVGAHFDVADAPENPTLFRSSLITTATLIREQRAACYPIHLAYLQIRIAELIDRPIDSVTKLFFCTATNGTELPLVDQFCERPVKWRDGFEYQSQRCAWEKPDGPGSNLDRIVFEAVKFQYSGIVGNHERITRHPSADPVAGSSN